MNDTTGAPVLIFVVTEDWYFVSHRLPLARAAREAGFHVVIAARFGDHEAELRREGFELVSLRLRRKTRSPVAELRAIAELRRLYRSRRPRIVHHVALKPVVFGSLAAWGMRDVALVNAVAGFGYTFSSGRIRARLGRALMTLLLRMLLGRDRAIVIVQNESDRQILLSNRIVGASQVRLIAGAGVDLESFAYRPEPVGPPVVMYAGRFLWDKGVGDFVEVARRARAARDSARFVLVGGPDEGNPASVPARTLAAWLAEGVVEYWGRRTDMPAVLAAAHVVCLPSRYGEGVPKILLEAASVGRAVVTTDWPGCRDATRRGETGLLVPPNDLDALEAAIRRLTSNADERKRFGASARRLAEREFDVRGVIEKTLQCYRELSQVSR